MPARSHNRGDETPTDVSRGNPKQAFRGIGPPASCSYSKIVRGRPVQPKYFGRRPPARPIPQHTMAATTDRARFHLEQYTAELNDWQRKELFTRPETTSIVQKRTAFEHTLAAQRSKPTDYIRYAEYEINLASLIRKRCRRLGIKGIKNYSGQRTVFYIYDRATKKIPGDLGLWVQYIRFCQQEKAMKKLSKVLTACLRLHPREWGVWILAAKWYAEDQADVRTARSYMQRGLRFCKDKKELWLEYCKLEMVYLAKLAARRKVLGLDEERKVDDQVDEGDDMITLPTVTAADFTPDTSKGAEEIDQASLQRLEKAPALAGAIPVAIFDAAMKQFADDQEIAEHFFDLIYEFSAVPAARKILQHILAHLQSTSPQSPEAIICEARFSIFAFDTLSGDFPSALGTALSTIKRGYADSAEKQKTVLAEKTVVKLTPLLEKHGDMDEDLVAVLVATINRYAKACSQAVTKDRVTREIGEKMKIDGNLGAEELTEIGRERNSSSK